MCKSCFINSIPKEATLATVGQKKGDSPEKKALTSDGKKGVSMKGGGRELIAELPGVPPLSRMMQQFFLLSSLHLATLVDRGWPSEAVDKRGGDPPLPSGKVPKAKQNGPTTTGMQREGHVSAFPKCIIWPCINFP